MVQAVLNGLSEGAVLGLIAVGFGLVYLTTRTFQIAIGAIFTLGTYLGYSFVVTLGWPAPLAGVMVVALCYLAGAVLEVLVYGPLARKRASAEVTMIASLGLYTAAVNGIALAWGTEAKQLREEIDHSVQVGSATVTDAQLVQVVVLGVVAAGLALTLARTRAGHSWRAVADNPVLATVLGMDVRGIRVNVVGLGSALAGLAGYLQALDVGTDPNVGFSAVLTAAIATVLGGIGVFLAPIAGALLLGVLQSLVVWYTSAKWEDAVTFGLLILLLIFRPQGLLGLRRRVEEQ